MPMLFLTVHMHIHISAANDLSGIYHAATSVLHYTIAQPRNMCSHRRNYGLTRGLPKAIQLRTINPIPSKGQSQHMAQLKGLELKDSTKIEMFCRNQHHPTTDLTPKTILEAFHDHSNSRSLQRLSRK